MTKEEILAMETDQLDIAIGELILGWHRKKRKDPLSGCGYTWHQTKRGYIHTCQCSFSPSTDILDAWQVVEKMRNELFSFRLRFLNSLQEQTYHEVQGTGEKVYIAWPDVFWSITPEAISKAALIAKLEVE